MHVEYPDGTAADALLALLKLRGIDYLFANSGTDFPSIIEGLAKARKTGSHHPQPVLVAHEFAAVSMAHGFYMVSGRPQAAMVHVNVGTANGLAAVMNAQRANVPLLFFAGRTPITEAGSAASRDIHSQWGQEMFDQASMLREIVKWDYELRDPGQVESVIDRALAIAMSEPRGPVYISLPREVLAERRPGFRFASDARQTPVSPLHPDPGAVQLAAEFLGNARSPLIITGHAGRDVEAVPLLAGVAERFAIPVVEFRATHLCLPDDHPMHLGFEADPYVGSADAILVLDCDVPWVPARNGPADDCPVIQVAGDPLYRDYPMRSFASDVCIASGAARFLPLLEARLEKVVAGRSRVVSERRDKISRQSALRRETARAELGRGKGEGPMSQAWALHCIDRIKSDEDIVVSEYPVLMRRDAISFRRPGSYFGMSPAGALGWGLPAAVGAKLAAPQSTVMALLGDGSYMFSNPIVCHQAAAAMKLPLLTVLFNNGRWDATHRYTTRMYPNGVAATERDFPLAAFDPAPDYELLCKAVGGYAERVARPDQLAAALDRALAVVKTESRQALLNVLCA